MSPAGSEAPGSEPLGWEEDPEIRASFIAESRTLLEEAEHLALRIERGAGDADDVDALFRCLHTIKGTAGFLGLPEVVRLAHDAESLLDPLRNDPGQWHPDVIEQLIGALDQLASIIGELASGTTEGLAGSVPAEWTRVRTQRLDQMLETIGEMVVLQSMLVREAERIQVGAGPLRSLFAGAHKLARELQDLGLGLRMVALRPTFRKLTRLARDFGQNAGKSVELIVRGDDVELDRNIADLLVDPLTHMLRNAIDHGIESPAERERLGKPPAGRLTLTAEAAADHVVVKLADDGRGLDRERIRARAEALGWIPAGGTPSEADLLDFIFAPGFSTADRVTEVSGRGVGMDVVRRNVEAMRGRIEVESVTDAGTSFRLVVPLTLSVTDAMLVRIAGESYLIPLLDIRHSCRLEHGALHEVAGRGEVVSIRGELLSVVRLASLLGASPAARPPERPVVVVVAVADRRCALLVDEVAGQRQVIARPLEGALHGLVGFAATAVLGDGQVGLILDVPAILGPQRAQAA